MGSITMSAPHQHLIQNGDQPYEDVARCEASGCGFSFRHPDRKVRMAESYRHLADVIDPRNKETNA